MESNKKMRSTGKRKSAIVQAMFKTKSTGQTEIFVSYSKQKRKEAVPLEQFFQDKILVQMIEKPLYLVPKKTSYDIWLKVNGGGFAGQAGAACLAIARSLAKLSKENQKILRENGMLTRDARVKERRKPGLKKARKAPQFSKR